MNWCDYFVEPCGFNAILFAVLTIVAIVAMGIVINETIIKPICRSKQGGKKK